MEPEVLSELAAQSGEALVALEEPGELVEHLGDRAKVVRPLGASVDPGEKVSLAVLDAAVVGGRALIMSPLDVDGGVEPGVYGRREVVTPVRDGLRRLWSVSPEPSDLPEEGWAAKREAARSYLSWRAQRFEVELPEAIEKVRRGFREGYEEGSEHLEEAERGFWKRVDVDGIRRFLDTMDTSMIGRGRSGYLVDPATRPGGEVTADLIGSLDAWIRELGPELEAAVDASGPVARRISRDTSVGRGIALIAASLAEESPSWRDALFGAGTGVLLKELGGPSR